MASSPSTGAAKPDVARIEAAFAHLREELGIRTAFPPEVEAEAAEAAKRISVADGERADRTAIPLATIDPPGSRDLDQAFAIERAGAGLRLWYAIADVGFFVDRGGAVEREAWLRGVTIYGPDRREPLYPAVLSQGAASLLPDEARPAILFGFELDERAEIVSATIERALVRSRAQLTYAQALQHVESGGETFRGKEWADSLTLLKEFGEKRRDRERDRGGVSLPIAQQHVQHSAATRLGYDLEYEQPNAAEEWNAQMSLLTGHLAGTRMLKGGLGLLRTMPAPEEERLKAFRHAARALKFAWPKEMGYNDFIRSLPLDHPCLLPLVWQAKRVTGGADYVAFDGTPPADPLHHALAMEYAHVTAPLRRLADRYVLDLLVELEKGTKPSAEARATLAKLPGVMNEAETREGRMERRAIDVAEAWTLQSRTGETFAATVLGVRGGKVEVQIEHPPVRVEVRLPENAPYLDLGESLRVRLESVSVEEGKLNFALEI